MNDETLEAVRRDYKVFTAIEQQLKDVVEIIDSHPVTRGTVSGLISPVLQVIQQHKEYLYKKYPL